MGADDTVSAKEGRREDVHGTTLSVGHADLASEQLANNTLYGASAQDGERVAPVGSDDPVVLGDTVLETDRDSFLRVEKAFSTPAGLKYYTTTTNAPGQWPNGRTRG